MKKQSQFLKISILFIMVLIFMGVFTNAVLATKDVQVTDNKAEIEVKWAFPDQHEEQKIQVRAGETISLSFKKENRRLC